MTDIVQRRRRDLLKASIAVPLLGACSARSMTQVERVDTLVIGGGMSGLAAALTLESGGQSVQLIEANTRLGGRCFTLHTGDGNFDCGATTIGPLYGRLRSLAARAGVKLVAPPGRDPFSYHINGKFIKRDDWQRSNANRLSPDEAALRPEALEFALVQKHNQIQDLNNWRNDDTLAFDVPLDQYLSQKGVSDEALRLIGVTTNAMSMSQTSALFQMREFTRLGLPNREDSNREVYAAASDGKYHYVQGGTSRLVEGLASQLATAPILGDPVVSIDVGPTQVEVSLRSGRRLRAKAAICTIPYSALPTVKISPTLSGLKEASVAQSRYTVTTHVFCIPESPYWELDDSPAGLLTDDVLERVFANRDASGQVAWLDVWVNGSGAAQLDQLTEADRLRFVEQRLGELRPSTRGKVRAVATYSWGQNPFVRGNKQVLAPGQVTHLYPAMAQPWQRRLRFAGEHTRNLEAGLEAAVATGIREAVAVLDGMRS